MEKFKDSNKIRLQGELLKKRLQDEGYLFLAALIPKEDVLKVRQKMISILNEFGWIDNSSGNKLDDAVGNEQAFVPDTDPVSNSIMKKQISSFIIRDLQHHRNLISLFKRIFDHSVFPLPRVIPRTLFPNQDEHTTPPHQDYPHVQGSRFSYAAWIPLGDCEKDMGGLAIASQSNKEGVLPIIPAMGAGGMAVLDKYQDQWRFNPLSSGDVIIFNCLTVHKGVPNHSKKLRISIDMRYQATSDTVCEDWLKPHRNLISWEELYKDWPDKKTQYYWRECRVKTVPFNDIYYEKRNKLAFQMSHQGDKNALATLKRIHRIALENKDGNMLKKVNNAIQRLN